jgi:hypothetical protein
VKNGEAVAEWVNARRIISDALRGLGLPAPDRNAEFIIAKLAGELMVITHTKNVK